MLAKIPLVLIATALVWATYAKAQTVHRRTFPRSSLAAQRSSDGFPAKRTAYQLHPAAGPARGLLVLLPGRGEPARMVFRATTLAQQAAQRGFLVVVPALNNRRYLDTASTQFLDDVLAATLRQYPHLARRVVLGGFSAGGQLAIRYAEKLLSDTLRQPWRVRAVLGVDPPLDLRAHWQRADYHLAKQDCAAFRPSDQRTLQELTRDMGGSPTQFPEAYLTRTAFSRNSPTGGNARWLAAVPIRLYCEPDLAFWRQQCPALELADLNADGAAALITFLQHQGNTQAHYIETTGKGFIGRQRMPHSWSIIDAPDCAQWLQHCLK